MSKIINALRANLLALTALLVVTTGFAGYLLQNFELTQVISTSHRTKIILDSLLQSMQLFTLGARPVPGADNWALVVARLGGALVAFSAIGKLVIIVFARARRRARLATIRNHVVICGYGDHGRLFARGSTGIPVVVVDLAANDLDASPESTVIHISGDALDPRVLRHAALHKAGTLIIGTGEDERNLSIARSALQTLSFGQKRTLDLIVVMNSPLLLDTIVREDAIMQPASNSRPVNVKLFNSAREAALALLQHPRWAQWAISQHQPRIHLVLVGASDACLELLLQFVRTSPCFGLERPLIEVLAPQGTFKQRLLNRAPNLHHLLRSNVATSDQAPLAWAADVRIHDVDPSLDSIADLVNQISNQKSLTAVVIAAGCSVENIQVALSFKSEMERRDLPACPLHVYAPQRTSLEPLLRRDPNIEPLGDDKDLLAAPSIQGIIEPFGRLDQLCSSIRSSNERDLMAQRIHENYRTRRFEFDKPAASESSKPWGQLKETYRRANRRAADHLRTKQLSANHFCGRPLEQQGFPDSKDPKLVEALARIEHDSWRIDRELDGWRYSPTRDNRRLLHPDLVSYHQLDESIKELDREQIEGLRAIAR